ncbi:thiamine pyrophosphate-dependent enzyme [Portibacter marinus]|uniref:thiamine pyrophosphate-dependent enzyme n=1 Tax=Portibacter marinus TaxID=2898660 RepID=UPI001F335E73|nr:thiamine pyrophosphate-dependent enzyme [Portibacter marinus]
MKTKVKAIKNEPKSIPLEEALADFRLACLSREMSLLMRKEVLTGKAKFGIGGAGKELPLIAAAKTFKKGDYWAGYYRDQTAMMAKDLLNPTKYFSALYGDAVNDEFSGGRQMNNHFSTSFVDQDGQWLDQTSRYNVTSPLASLASNVPRALGLALASKSYKNNEYLNGQTNFSQDGNEVTFCVVGDATTSEGVFFEAINAAGVMQIPLAFIILDDGYGISVPSEYQTTKGDISRVLEGFRKQEGENGLDIYRVKAWDYEQLNQTFKDGINKIRNTSVPAIFHVQECTQPQGHSTSGSHQRYKSPERLEWEEAFDGLKKMKQWLMDQYQIEETLLNDIESESIDEVKEGRNQAWSLLTDPLKKANDQLLQIIADLRDKYHHYEFLSKALHELKSAPVVDRSEILAIAQRVSFKFLVKDIKVTELVNWIEEQKNILKQNYNTHLYQKGDKSALYASSTPVEYEEDAPMVNGFKVLNKYFDQLLRKDPRVYAFGEDVGKIGDVNQAFAGLQEKYGEDRVFDTGIREWTIVGQGIGMAMRGLRPIAEIQYLDYLAYAFSALTDDLATLHYRSNGRQIAPAIIRTRGHRLEGIWHSGSPMGMLLSSMRGIHILVPRNMTQAVGMYNTLLQSNDPAIIIECLNGYRKKERMPSNLTEFSLPLGIPEIIMPGEDVTVVTYGSTLHIAHQACLELNKIGIQPELIDVQTLLPFDLEHRIVASLQKTNRIIFIDEDVPGGATAFMMKEVLETQKGYFYLDAPPTTLTAKAHRPAYGNDGDYASKPNQQEIFRAIYNLVNEKEHI